jgi:phospholipid-binding lipoprotein MlaA
MKRPGASRMWPSTAGVAALLLALSCHAAQVAEPQAPVPVPVPVPAAPASGASAVAPSDAAPAPAPASASASASALALASASTPEGGAFAQGSTKKDPLESWNRSVFSFNESLDAAVLKPVSQAYQDVVPEYVRGLITNVFGNIADAWSAVNHLLQGKIESSLQMGMRVTVNSVLGFGGLLDIGTEIGLEKQPEDFGQTLGRWGVPAGPYMVLPVLGPSTVRDTGALALDLQASPSALINDTTGTVVGVTALQVVNTRAGLLGASRVLDDIALDKYSFLRDAYLARRQNQVYDGDPPQAPDDDADVEPPKPSGK